MNQLARATPQVADEIPSGQYELIVRLDQPFSGSSRCANHIALSGWVLAPPDSLLGEGRGPELTIVLEDLNSQQSILGAGLGQIGRELSLEDSGRGAFLESLVLTRLPGKFVDPSSILSGVQYSISGVLNVERLRPDSGEGSRLLAVSVVARLADRLSVSNKGCFSLLSFEAQHSACGGFLLPNLSIREVHSEFLIVHGWAVKSTSAVASVTVTVNARAVGDASIGLPSPMQARLLPDAAGVEHSAFCLLLSREGVRTAGVSTHELDNPINLSARICFADGELLELAPRAFRWSADILARMADATLFGRIEQVGESTRGFVHISGWVLDGALTEPSLRLEWARAGETFSSAPDSPLGLTRIRREDIATRYVTAAHSVDCGFTLEVPAAIFGRMPGAITLSALDETGKRSVLLEPSAMSSVIEEECARLRGDGGAVSVIDSVLRTGGHLQRKSRAAIATLAAAESGSNALPAAKALPERLLFATPNLSEVEGAPKVLFQVIRHFLKEAPHADMLVISAREGGLRQQLEDIGVRVQVIEALSMVEQHWERYLSGLRMVRTLCAEFVPQIVYANVIDSFWAVDFARRMGVPSLWAIHESIRPELCYFEHEESLRLAFFHALAYADSALFVAEQTRDLFSPLRRGPSRVIANGIDTAVIDAMKSALSRSTCRAVLGVEDQTFVVSIIGTTAKRKGQDYFIREAALLRAQKRDVRFFIVGARESDFLTELKELSEEAGLSDVLQFVAETPDVGRFFVASDAVVIASREESAPLVSLEAFAYGVPLLSTSVFGLAAQVEHRRNALCFSTDRAGELAAGLLELAQDSNLRQKLVAGGKETVNSRFALAPVMAEYCQEVIKVYRAA